MKNRHRLRLLLVTLLLLPACQLLKRHKVPKPVEGTENSTEGPTYLIGIIELVNPEQKFVLIKTEGRMAIPIGQELTALDATGALSKLVVSPERKANYLTADIREGNPRVTNLVTYRPKMQPAATTPADPSTPQVPEGPTPVPMQPPLSPDTPLSPALTPSSAPVQPVTFLEAPTVPLNPPTVNPTPAGPSIESR